MNIIKYLYSQIVFFLLSNTSTLYIIMFLIYKNINCVAFVLKKTLENSDRRNNQKYDHIIQILLLFC